ncbi:MAG: hypothetical protein V4812_07015 [Pseudomonadota bacterium]
MARLDVLSRDGLTVERDGERLRVTPARRITDAHRQYLRAHRDALWRELLSEAGPEPVPGGEPRRRAWPITRSGRPICWMIGEPITRDEALAVARWRWPDADIGAD